MSRALCLFVCLLVAFFIFHSREKLNLTRGQLKIYTLVLGDIRFLKRNHTIFPPTDNRGCLPDLLAGICSAWNALRPCQKYGVPVGSEKEP